MAISSIYSPPVKKPFPVPNSNIIAPKAKLTLFEGLVLEPSKNLDTLAQLRKLARNKFISNGLVFSLVDQVFSPLRKSYWNTFHCAMDLNQDGQKLTTRHCKNRWCTQCNKIRTAILIKGYLPQLQKFKDRRFITLTVPNVEAKMLETTINDMYGGFRRIKERLRKRGIKLHGLRKLECTYNSDFDSYHPHFHIVMDGEALGNCLIDEWLLEFSAARLQAQDNRPADENSTKELFKYFTKLVTKVGGKRVFHAASLDVIFRAMSKKRTFQPMGIKMIKETISESQDYEALAPNWKKWQWDEDKHDYIDKAGGRLTGYKPSEAVKSFRIGPPVDWRALNDEFKAIKRGDNDQFWRNRNEIWEKKAARMEKNCSMVDQIFNNFINSC